jgi:alkylated DNA nucleotide flippase Atl1
MVGRLMFRCPEDAPWWRVVNRIGALPIGKRSPQYAVEQRRRLEEEGVVFHGDCVDMAQFCLSVEQMEVLLGVPAQQE